MRRPLLLLLQASTCWLASSCGASDIPAPGSSAAPAPSSAPGSSASPELLWFMRCAEVDTDGDFLIDACDACPCIAENYGCGDDTDGCPEYDGVNYAPGHPAGVDFFDYVVCPGDVHWKAAGCEPCVARPARDAHAGRRSQPDPRCAVCDDDGRYVQAIP